MVALDASALVALLFREPGHERVLDEIDSACISSVNVVEVMFRFLREGVGVDDSAREIARLGIEAVALEPETACEVATLVAETRSAGLSLGDCACLALAKARGIPALTADRAWAKLDIGVEIELIR
ncbi:MAG: type II toxin-antitoxin system VapC family toxin [Alphaproteobacteria bacterium]|nr:type II toxin-antitoxin system VapC family toxin [Alphaproteobacteria bacterium]